MIRIGLNMIVKDEAKVIKRCLDSLEVENWIDYYYILDTGSSDDTVNIIKEYFYVRKIDGIVEQSSFTDFADCRNRALAGIKDKVDYVFWIDADEELKFDPVFSFMRLKSVVENNDFVYFRCLNKGFQFRNNHLFAADLDWVWHGAVHEFLQVAEPAELESETITGCSLIYNEDGNSWSDKTAKAMKHIELLEQQHKAEPKLGRWVFYLGQTWRAIHTRNAKLNAIHYYDERASMYKSGRDPEAYVSKLMSCCLRQEMGATLLASNFHECSKYDDSRIEHIIHANQIYWQTKSYSSAYMYSLEAYKRYMNPPLGVSELLLDISIYTFSCAHIHAINCFYVKRKKEGLSVLNNLMANIKKGKSPALVSNDELLRLAKALQSL